MSTHTFSLSSAKVTVEVCGNPPRNEGRKEQPHQEDTEECRQRPGGFRARIPDPTAHSQERGSSAPGASWPRTTPFRSEATPPPAQPPPVTGERDGGGAGAACLLLLHTPSPSAIRETFLPFQTLTLTRCLLLSLNKNWPPFPPWRKPCGPPPPTQSLPCFPHEPSAMQAPKASFTPELGAPKRKTPQ